MAQSSRPPSKYDYDVSIFTAEPPDHPKRVKSLFCGRDQELKQGVEILKRHLDVDGKRAQKGDKRPWVILGESRSGKSHLARRIMAELPRNARRVQITVLARERLEASRVMQTLFDELRSVYVERTRDQNAGLPDLDKSLIGMTDKLIEDVGRFSQNTEGMTLTLTEETRQGFDVGLRLPVVPLIVQFFARSRTQWAKGNAIQVKLRRPTPYDLAEFCAIMMDTLLRLGLLQHLLVLFDDVDLIEGYADAVRNARIQRSILSDAIARFHATPGVDVLLTARSWYAYSRRELETLVDLANAPEMAVEELTAIHDRRFQVFGRAGLPARFLDSAALATVAADARGMPGVFLQHLSTAFRAFQQEEKWGERDYNWYLAVFLRIFATFREKYPDAATEMERAVRDGRLTIDVEARNPFQSTVFDNVFVFQSFYRETTYFMDGLAQKVISL